MRITLFKNIFLIVFVSLFTINLSFAENRQIAITIDDLPFVGESKNYHLDMILNAIKTNEVPATGFVIAREVGAKNWEMLQKFKEAGLGLGNHTFSHANLNRMNSDNYIQDIESADRILAPVLTKPKYFRYPYLAMSEGAKKNKVLDYLAAKNYQIAPITIDSRDFIFNQLLLGVQQHDRRNFLKVLKPCYLDFIWQQTLKAEEHNRQAHKTDQAQILLIHANLLNAYVLPDIIDLFKQNGYTFISLTKALKSFEERTRMVKKEKPDPDSLIKKFFVWD